MQPLDLWDVGWYKNTCGWWNGGNKEEYCHGLISRYSPDDLFSERDHLGDLELNGNLKK